MAGPFDWGFTWEKKKKIGRRKNREEKYVDEIRRSSARDNAMRWSHPRDDAPQSLSQLCPFSNLRERFGQGNLCMPGDKRIAPVRALSFGAILPHLRWCVRTVVVNAATPNL
jgi:hypothetical protein